MRVRVCVCHSVRFKVCCDGRRPTVLTHLNSGSGWYVDVTVVIGAVVAGKDVDTLGAVGAEHGLEERQHVVPEEEGEETPVLVYRAPSTEQRSTQHAAHSTQHTTHSTQHTACSTSHNITNHVAEEGMKVRLSASLLCTPHTAHRVDVSSSLFG